MITYTIYHKHTHNLIASFESYEEFMDWMIMMKSVSFLKSMFDNLKLVITKKEIH